MRAATIILIVLSGLPIGVRAQMAVTDPALTSIQQANLSLTQTWQAFQKLQMVQDAEFMLQTAQASQSYWKMYQADSMNKGGLLGYYTAYAKQELDQTADQTYRQVYNNGSLQNFNSPEGNLISNGVAALNQQTGAFFNGVTASAVGAMNTLDAGYKNARATIFNQAQASAAARDQVIVAENDKLDGSTAMIQDVVTQASGGGISAQQSESIAVHTQALMLQQLFGIRRLIQLQDAILNDNVKSDLAEQSISLQAAGDLAKFRATRGQNATVGATPDQLNGAMRGIPGQ